MAGLGTAVVSSGNTPTYNVTMYTYWLKKPTTTSVGYYIYIIKNNIIEYTEGFNMGSNGI